ncbi:hypothetical protein MTO96_052323 [Rhipicephalus appendiculatus]
MSRCNSSTTVEIVEGGSCPSRPRSPSPSVCIMSATEPRPPSPSVCIVTESSRPPVAQPVRGDRVGEAPVAQRNRGEGRGAVAQLLRREEQAHLVAHHRLRGERGRAAAAAEARPFAQRVHRHVVVVAAAPAVARRVHRDGGQAAITRRVHCH